MHITAGTTSSTDCHLTMVQSTLPGSAMSIPTPNKAGCDLMNILVPEYDTNRFWTGRGGKGLFFLAESDHLTLFYPTRQQVDAFKSSSSTLMAPYEIFKLSQTDSRWWWVHYCMGQDKKNKKTERSSQAIFPLGLFVHFVGQILIAASSFPLPALFVPMKSEGGTPAEDHMLCYFPVYITNCISALFWAVLWLKSSREK